MRLPQLVGYRIVSNVGRVQLIGRNAFLPLTMVLMLMVMSLPFVFIFGEPSAVRDHPGSLPLFLALFVLGGYGTFYTATKAAFSRNLIFTLKEVIIKDHCLIGHRERSISCFEIERFEFTLFWPRRSLFKIANIYVHMKSGESARLTEADMQLYSWQGVDAYHAIHALFSQVRQHPVFDTSAEFKDEQRAIERMTRP